MNTEVPVLSCFLVKANFSFKAWPYLKVEATRRVSADKISDQYSDLLLRFTAFVCDSNGPCPPLLQPQRVPSVNVDFTTGHSELWLYLASTTCFQLNFVL